MKYLIALLCVTIGLIAALPRTCGASEPFAAVTGTTYEFLRLPSGVRNLALGRAGAADDSDPLNQYYNPAVLLTIEGIGASYGRLNSPYGSYLIDTDLDDFAVWAGKRLPLDAANGIRIAGALRYTELTIRYQPGVYTIFLPGGTIDRNLSDVSDSHLTLALAGGLITERLEVGVGFAVKPITSEFFGEETNAWAFDVGLLAKTKFEVGTGFRLLPTVGFSVVNLGKDVDYDGSTAKLPRQVRVGAGLRVESPAHELFGRRVPLATVCGITDYVDEAHRSREHIGAGLELGFIDILYARLGYYDTLDDGYDGNWYHGVGLAWFFRGLRLSLEHAHFVKPFYLENYDVDAYSISVNYTL